MKIGIYALAKNESKHAAAWAESCKDADVRVVTDTGSTDDTVQLLEAAGVTVARGAVVPWRWDEAHNLSLHHLPADVDVAMRLDLDERLQPGWREAIERAYTGDVNNLRYRYVWSRRPDGSPGLVFMSDRVHARAGFRWTMATHEGLICWAGEKRQAAADGLEVVHHRDPDKQHKTDLMLLQVAVREAPQDARARWYYARELDYMGAPEAAAEFAAYLRMPGGQATERAYARRVLYRHTGDERWLTDCVKEAPGEPDGWVALSLARYHEKRWPEVLDLATQAIRAGDQPSHAMDPDAKGRAYDLASVACWELGRRPEALAHARAALGYFPEDGRIQTNVREMERAA